MKNALLVLSLFLSGITLGYSQESIIEEIDYQKLDRLIELAKNHYPRRKAMQVQERMAKSAITLESLGFLDMVNVHYFYRPNNQPSFNETNPYVFNGFQFGVGLNLSNLIARPFRIRQAKQQLTMARLESEEYDKSLEKDVKAAYYNYIQSGSELRNRTAAVQDSRVLFERLQTQFELGEVDIETYTAARTNSSEANSALNQSEVNYLLAKDDLEELIGIKLEELD